MVLTVGARPVSYKEVAGGVLARFNQAERVAIAAYAEGRAEHEPSITDRLLGGIELALNGYTEHGVVWRAKTFTSQGGESDICHGRGGERGRGRRRTAR